MKFDLVPYTEKQKVSQQEHSKSNTVVQMQPVMTKSKQRVTHGNVVQSLVDETRNLERWNAHAPNFSMNCQKCVTNIVHVGVTRSQNRC